VSAGVLTVSRSGVCGGIYASDFLLD
jgi:hypothetical protein